MISIYHHTLDLETQGNKTTFFNLKDQCCLFVLEKKIQNGILVVQSPHTTCAIFFEEMVHDVDALGDEFLQHDLSKGLNRIFPKQLSYDDEYQYPGPKHRDFGSRLPGSEFSIHPAILLNGDAHCKGSLIGSSSIFTVQDGEINFGTFGSVYFVDFDGNRARKRHCHLCLIGETF